MGSVIEQAHEVYAKGRRIQVLSRHYAELIPRGARVLDVGTGDGAIARLAMEKRPDIEIEGVETLEREGCAIPVRVFDGVRLPFDDKSWDYVSFIDVLHHTDDPFVLLKEAARVAKRGVIVKDHLVQGVFAWPTLRFMDGVGNRRYGVVLPYNYKTPSEWAGYFERLDLTRADWREDLGIYPSWANWLFGRGLHYFARLEFEKAGGDE